MASACQPLVQCQPSITDISEQFTVLDRRPWRAAEFGWFCRGEPRNFASWPAEFGKVIRRKLWALPIILNLGSAFTFTHTVGA